MAIGEIHIGDIGTVFEVTIKDQDNAIVDISGATTLKVLFLKPDETVLEKDGVVVGDGTTGKMRYTTISGDLDSAGTWEIQGYVVDAGGSWKSDRGYFEVYGNIT